MPQKLFEPEETNTLLALSIFAVFWSLVGIPFITSNPDFVSLNPVLQYVLSNLSLIVASVVVFGTVLTFLLEREYDIQSGIVNGLVAWLGFSFILDMWESPFAWDLSGKQLIFGAGVTSSVDYMWGYIFLTLFPQIANTSLLYLAVYGLVPILTVAVGALVLTKGQFLSWFNFGGVNGA